LQAQLRLAVKQMRASEAELGRRRKALTALETRQRLASRSVSGTADREAERALALAEQAKDLDALASRLDQEGELRNALARLPGPVLRPARPQDALVVAMETAPLPPAGLPVYVLPLSGKLLAGFGDSRPGLPQSRGIVLAARQGAQAVAPAPYPGYGSIVIIEHAGGWTSLVTGLAQLDIQVGDRLVAGSPLGIAGAGRPILTLELRRAGVPVNPLEYIRAL
jgi:murein hydrolase activator